jgi:hypothetical protein
MRQSIALSAMVLFLTGSAAMADPSSPSDLQQLFNLGDYPSVVKGATEALASGAVSDAADRYKVDTLKGEASLKLRQAGAAASAFSDAAKDTANARQAFVAQATAILISRSEDLIYTSQRIKPTQPKASAPKALASMAIGADPPTTEPVAENKPVVLSAGQYDIIDPVHRTSALAAMWADERADAEKVIKAKIAAKTLPAINDALARIHQSEPIAVAGGSPDWAQSKEESLAGAARLNANMAMKEMNTKLIAISKSQVARHNKQPPKSMPQGDRDQINKMTEALNQMIVALKALPEALNVDRGSFGSQLDEAQSIVDHATTVLAAN